MAKRVMIMIAIVVLLACTILFFVLSAFLNKDNTNQNGDLSTDYSFLLSHNTIYAGENIDGEYIDYTLFVTSKVGDFVNPSVLISSGAVFMGSSNKGEVYEIYFHAVSSGRYTFEISSDNLSPVYKNVDAVAIDNSMSVKFYNNGGVELNPDYQYDYDKKRFLLYKTSNSSNETLAKENGLHFDFNFKVFANDFEYENYTITALQNLVVENNKLTPINHGNASMRLTSRNGNVVTTIYFVCKSLPVEAIANLPAKIDLDLNSNVKTYELQYEIIPSYGEDYSFEILNDSVAKLDLENGIVEAKGVGETSLVVYVGGEIFVSIAVCVTNSAYDNGINLNKAEFLLTTDTHNAEIVKNSTNVYNLNITSNLNTVKIKAILDDGNFQVVEKFPVVVQDPNHIFEIPQYYCGNGEYELYFDVEKLQASSFNPVIILTFSYENISVVVNINVV